MRIQAINVLLCSPGLAFCTVRITTDDGAVGYGDGTLNGRELAVASYLTDHLAPALIGFDASRINDIWQYCYKGAYWRRGPVTMSAISAIDQALWDLNAKALGVPVHRLLGGRARDCITVYRHCTGHTVEAAVEDAGARLAEGYRAVRVQAQVPGVDTAPTASPGATRSTNPPAAPCRRSRSGTPAPIWTSCRSSSGPSGTSSATASSCCTTATTASPRARPAGWAAGSSPTGCSGSRTPCPRRTSRPSPPFAVSPAARSPSARSGTACTTATTRSATG